MNESKPGRRAVALAIAAALCGLADSPTAFADTLPGALAQAYVNNPTLNAQRAALRATDEGVPIALSGYRPTVKGTIVEGSNDQYQTTKTEPAGAPGTPNGQPLYPGNWRIYANQSYNVTATQTLYNGFQTANRTRQAESQVSAGRETLRLTELNLLLQAATAYMNLLRDTALLDLNRTSSFCKSSCAKAAIASTSAKSPRPTLPRPNRALRRGARSLRPPSRNTSRRRRSIAR
jgi:outer membrane protein